MYAMPGGEGLTRQVAAISCFVEVADALNRELVMVGLGITWVQHVKWVAFSLLATHRMPLSSRKEGGFKMRVNDVAGHGAGSYCSPRQRIPLSSRDEGWQMC